MVDRDYTRFLTDETFPHKVTAYIGDERMYCSGAILAEQSSILEKKIRDDDGVLMFDEMVEIGKPEQLIHCLEYLHGAKLKIDEQNIEVTIKFSSWYEIGDLFKKCLKWSTKLLDKSKKIVDVLLLLKISTTLNPADSKKLSEKVNEFISDNVAHVCSEVLDEIKNGTEICGFNLITILKHDPLNDGEILAEWSRRSPKNKDFIINNAESFNFNELFPSADTFASFIESILDEAGSMNNMKAIIKIQQEYLKSHDAGEKCSSSSSGFGDEEGDEVEELTNMWVDTSCLGGILGKRGAKIKEIERTYRVKISIKKDEIRDQETKVVLIGAFHDVEECRDYIHDIVDEEIDRQAQEPTSCESDFDGRHRSRSRDDWANSSESDFDRRHRSRSRDGRVNSRRKRRRCTLTPEYRHSSSEDSTDEHRDRGKSRKYNRR